MLNFMFIVCLFLDFASRNMDVPFCSTSSNPVVNGNRPIFNETGLQPRRIRLEQGHSSINLVQTGFTSFSSFLCFTFFNAILRCRLLIAKARKFQPPKPPIPASFPIVFSRVPTSTRMERRKTPKRKFNLPQILQKCEYLE